MTGDRTMRIVWYKGRPYGISNNPFGRSESRTHWYIQIDGEWHRLFERVLMGADANNWAEVEKRALDWLTARDAARQR